MVVAVATIRRRLNAARRTPTRTHDSQGPRPLRVVPDPAASPLRSAEVPEPPELAGSNGTAADRTGATWGSRQNRGCVHADYLMAAGGRPRRRQHPLNDAVRGDGSPVTDGEQTAADTGAPSPTVGSSATRAEPDSPQVRFTARSPAPMRAGALTDRCRRSLCSAISLLYPRGSRRGAASTTRRRGGRTANAGAASAWTRGPSSRPERLLHASSTPTISTLPRRAVTLGVHSPGR